MRDMDKRIEKNKNNPSNKVYRLLYLDRKIKLKKVFVLETVWTVEGRKSLKRGGREEGCGN
jgi:hypothetical protein